MNDFRPGDPAIIIKCPPLSDLAGRIVTVERRWPADNVSTTDWEVSLCSPARNLRGQLLKASSGWRIPDDALRPWRQLPDAELRDAGEGLPRRAPEPVNVTACRCACAPMAPEVVADRLLEGLARLLGRPA